MSVDGELTCSARGCRRSGTWILRWNNPKLHPPERRKSWVACADHRDFLAEFLTVRGFLRETVPTDPPGAAPDESPVASPDERP